MNKTGNRWKMAVTLVLTSLIVAGCSGKNSFSLQQGKESLPPIVAKATDKHYPGKFVWHDLITDDVSKAKQFYAGVFGWTFEDKGGYTTIYHQGKAIGGMMQVAHNSDKEPEAVWLPSLSVENVDHAISQVKEGQGHVLRGPVDMPQRGRGVLVSDAQGAHVVLLESKAGDPLDTKIKIGDWLWNELWTSKPHESATLYRKLGKYSTVSQTNGYHILKSKEKWRAGIRDVSKEDSKSRWVSVVRVADLQKSMDKVMHFGGQVLMKPHKEVADGNVAVIADNTGALLLIQRWSDSTEKGSK